MDSRLCMHVWTSASPDCRPGSTDTRDHAHASCLGTGWAPTHMPTLPGADCCEGGYGGHNGRMWSIVLAHGANGAGAVRDERNSLTHVATSMTDGSKSWTRARGNKSNRELELFTAVDLMGCYNKVGRKGEKVMKMTNIEQVLPYYIQAEFFLCPFVAKQALFKSISVRTLCYNKFGTFQVSLAAMYNLIRRHQWECKLEWVRMWNVPQPIRRLNLRLTANQVMVLQDPERRLNSAQRTFLKRSWTFRSRRSLLPFLHP